MVVQILHNFPDNLCSSVRAFICANLDMIDLVDEGHTLAGNSMDRLDVAMNRMTNSGAQTTQMLSHLSTFMSNVGEGDLRNLAHPLVRQMMNQLRDQLSDCCFVMLFYFLRII